MPITTEVAELESSANTTTYTSPAFTPTAKSILVAIVSTAGLGAGSAGAFSDTGMGLTWTTVFSSSTADAASNWVTWGWALVGASPVSTTVVYTTNRGTGTYCHMEVYQAIAADPANPIRQSTTGTGTGIDPTLAFVSALLGTNSYIAVADKGTTGASFTAQSGWTQDTNGVYNGGSPDRQCSAQHRDGDESTALTVVFDFAANSVTFTVVLIEVASSGFGSQVIWIMTFDRWIMEKLNQLRHWWRWSRLQRKYGEGVTI